MSLFKVREWWSTHCGSDENFDTSCLCIGNADNNPAKTIQILVGSHSGVLRVYQPSCKMEEDGTFEGYKPDHLLLECQMSQAVLQVSLGKFVSGSDKVYIALLHPRKLSVYSITGNAGDAEPGTQYHLSLMYEHNLQYSSFSLVKGTFGGVKDREFVCVQSVDGALSFFEQGSFAFTRFLPEFLLPGPFAYVSKTDSFVTVNTAFHFESYRFQTLAVATEAAKRPPDDADVIPKGKRIVADWSVSIGEEAMDITVADFSNAPTLILVLGERTLFAFKPSGELHFLKMLDYSSACLFPYPSANEGSIMLLMATQRSTLLVYQDTTLKWAAQLTFAPVAVARATIQSIEGAVVALSDEGQLQCCYLGTDPSLFVAQAPESRDFSFRETEEELKTLEKLIKSATESFPGSKKAEGELKIKVITSTVSEVPCLDDGAYSDDGDTLVPSVIVKVHLETSTPLHDVHVVVQVARPLVALNGDFTLSSLLDYHQMAFTVKQAGDALPSSLELKVVAVYQSKGGASKVAQASLHLPLSLVAQPCMAEKASEHKLTIETNKPAVPSNELFSDFVSDITSQTVGMQFLHGPQVSILVSRSSQKYRIQSDSFAALWLPTMELIRRLHQYYKRSNNGEALKYSFSSNLPLQEYFDIIDKYFEVRQRGMELEEHLGQRAAQFRVVQKCVLTKLKDKTPTPLNNFDSLLEVTQRELLSLANQQMEACKAHENVISMLSSASQLILLLLKLKVQMNSADFKIFQAAFAVDLNSSIKEGWEEKLEAALCHLLQTGLRNLDEEPPPVPTEFVPLKDVARLKTLIAVTFERLLDGAQLSLDLPKRTTAVKQAEDCDQDGSVLRREEMFELSGTALLSPVPGPSTSKSAKQDSELERWMAESQESGDPGNDLSP
uniref:Putative coiled-coil protein n=1 Tax=Ixodes ricinus TaxID=34613 RepID=V5HVG6_IXORI